MCLADLGVVALRLPVAFGFAVSCGFVCWIDLC